MADQKKEKKGVKSKKPVLQSRSVKLTAFVIIVAALIICSFLCIMAIWGYADADVAWRSFATFMVIIVGTLLFVVANEQLG